MHDRILKAMFAFIVILSIALDIFQISSPWLLSKDIVAASRALPLNGLAQQADYQPMMAEVARHQTFLSTFEWWHRSFAGDVPFWRPLTSQAWWLEMRFFGYDHLDKYQWVTVVSHLIVVGLFVVLTQRLTGQWLFGLLAALVYSGTRTMWPFNVSDVFAWIGGTPANVSLGEWKFQQDVWASAAILGCLVCVCDRRWILALVCAFVSVCFKETGWLSFPLALIVLIALRRLKQVPWWVYGATLVTIVTLIGLRASSGSAVMRGYDIGTNAHWLARYLNAIAGTFVSLLTTPSAPSAILAAALLALIVWRRGHLYLKTALAIAAILGSGALLALTKHCSVLVGLSMLVDPAQETIHVLVAILWLVFAYVLVRDLALRGLAFSFLLMTWLSALTYVAATQVLVHVLYVAYQFDSVVVALALIAAAKAIRRLSGRLDSQGVALGSA